MLADQTDGRAIVNRNDLESRAEAGRPRLERLLPDRLQLDASPAPTASSTRSRCGTKRPGVQVRARKGYWALTRRGGQGVDGAAQRRPPPPAVTKALGSIAEPRRARFIRSWIGTARGENGKTRVTFVWEPLPPVPGQDRNQATGVSLIATGAGRRQALLPRSVPAADGGGGSSPAAPASAASARDAGSGAGAVAAAGDA